MGFSLTARVHVFLWCRSHNVIGPKEPELRSVLSAMFTVFRCVTDGCTTYQGPPLQERLAATYGPIFMLVYILVFMFVTFGLFNLIMAVFIDNVVTSSTARKQKELGLNTDRIKCLMEGTFAQLIFLERPTLEQESKVQRGISKISPEAGRRWSGMMSESARTFESLPAEFAIPRNVFNLWLREPVVEQMLEMADIDTSNKFELFDVLDVDMGGELGLDELIAGLMRLRGPITKSDIVAMRSQVRFLTKSMLAVIETLGCSTEPQT